jgi:hypothetical protein
VNRPITCAVFDDHADGLALGAVDEPMRSRLLDHAASCAECRSLLDGLGTVVDRLLVLAPEAEPPGGFESRVLARLGAPAVPARRGRLASRFALAAAAVVALLGVGLLVAVVGRDADQARLGAIVTVDDVRVGDVRLVAEPQPHVLVTVDRPRPGPGTRFCELRIADGTWVEVGSWELEEIASGVWAVGIAPGLLEATAMRVTLDDGTVVATATF